MTKNLSKLFPDRVKNMPISESGIVGMGAGLSVNNSTTICEIMFGDFITLTAYQIINHCAKFGILHLDSKPSIILRTPVGGGRGYGATHSQNLEKIFGGIPGVSIDHISFLHDISFCFQSSLQKGGCTIISEPKLQYICPLMI